MKMQNRNMPYYNPSHQSTFDPPRQPNQPGYALASINEQQNYSSKNIMYGGNAILRNGSNSYRPLLMPDSTYLPQQKVPKFKPLQRTIESSAIESSETENPDRVKSVYR